MRFNTTFESEYCIFHFQLRATKNYSTRVWTTSFYVWFHSTSVQFKDSWFIFVYATKFRVCLQRESQWPVFIIDFFSFGCFRSVFAELLILLIINRCAFFFVLFAFRLFWLIFHVSIDPQNQRLEHRLILLIVSKLVLNYVRPISFFSAFASFDSRRFFSSSLHFMIKSPIRFQIWTVGEGKRKTDRSDKASWYWCLCSMCNAIDRLLGLLSINRML